MSEAANFGDKLGDEILLRMALGEQGGSVNVIIELALPPQRIDFVKHTRRGREAVTPKRVAPYAPEEEREIATKTAAAKEFLRRSLAKPPVPLHAARAFAAEVTGDELRMIVGSPLVKAVRISRTLK